MENIPGKCWLKKANIRQNSILSKKNYVDQRRILPNEQYTKKDKLSNRKMGKEHE
jgi:hypothetical protein